MKVREKSFMHKCSVFMWVYQQTNPFFFLNTQLHLKTIFQHLLDIYNM